MTAVQVALALVWREGCLLVTRRRAEAHLGGFWEFPGGKCLPGESPAAAAEREVLEEVGVACRAVRELSPIYHEYEDRAVWLYPVQCEYVGGPPRPLEVAEWAWRHPAALHPEEFPPANAALIEQLRGAPG